MPMVGTMSSPSSVRLVERLWLDLGRSRGQHCPAPPAPRT